MANRQQSKDLFVPQRLFRSMIEAQRKWEEFSHEFEDFLVSSDKEFVKKIERARKEHLEGEVRDLQELKQELR